MSFPEPTSKPAPLNPGMVYPPLSPSLSPSSDGVKAPFRLHVTIVRYLRLLTLLLSIIAIFFWTAVGLRYGPWSTVIFVFLCLVLALNIIALLGHRRKGGSSRLSCQIGSFQCSCGSDDTSSGMYELAIEGNDGDWSGFKKPLTLLWILDLIFGLHLFIFYFVAFDRWGYWIRGPRMGALILSLVVACFELTIGVLSPFKVFRGFIVYFTLDDDERDARRIQLPHERPARPAQPISVSA